MLTRIYGVTFPKQKELEDYLTLLEEAKRRDHRKLGQELDLFTFSLLGLKTIFLMMTVLGVTTMIKT